jgi:hypothetical protein
MDHGVQADGDYQSTITMRNRRSDDVWQLTDTSGDISWTVGGKKGGGGGMWLTVLHDLTAGVGGERIPPWLTTTSSGLQLEKSNAI